MPSTNFYEIDAFVMLWWWEN